MPETMFFLHDSLPATSSLTITLKKSIEIIINTLIYIPFETLFVMSCYIVICYYTSPLTHTTLLSQFINTVAVIFLPLFGQFMNTVPYLYIY